MGHFNKVFNTLSKLCRYNGWYKHQLSIFVRLTYFIITNQIKMEPVSNSCSVPKWGQTPWVKVPAAEPDDQSSVPGAHMVGGEN